MAGWRGGQRRRDPVSAPKPAAGKVPSSKKSGWHGSSPTVEGPRRDGGLWLKRFLASGTVLAILFLLVTILLWNRSPTPLAILSVHSHPADLNFVIPARPGANLNAGIQSRKFNYLKVISKGKNTESNLSVQLDDIVDFRHGGPDKNVVLICIAAQGVVNGKGEPCLLDTESKPFDETTWKPLKELFHSLIKRVSPSNGTHVVVFLDSGSAETDWSMGWLRDDFKERLNKTVENAVDVLPKNWHLVHVRGTADLSAFARTGRRVQFADVLSFGLRGAADGASGKQLDQKISLSEMIAFIKSETGVAPDAWPALENARNTLNLCWAEKLSPNDKPKPLMIGSVPDKLRELWMMHHELEEKLPWRRYPWVWARFEWQLLRAERAWLAADARMEKIVKEASVQAETLKPLLGTTKAIKPPGLDDEWEKFFGQLKQTTNLDAMPKSPPGNSSAAALALLLNRDVRGTYSETTGAKEGNSAIAELIRLRRDADSGVWPNDFRAESIVRYQADRIDEKRRALEDLAFVGGGERNWEQILGGVNKVRQEYEVPITKSDDFAKRLSQRDRLFARLPWLFQWAEMSRGKDDLRRHLVEIWNEAAEQIRSFERGVSDPLVASDWEKWDEACRRFEELHKKLVDDAKLLSTTSKDSPRDYVRKVLPYLATPLVSGLTRKELLDRLIKDANVPSTQDKNDLAEIRPDSPSFVNWKSHPLNVMLKTEIKVSKDDDATRLEKLPVVEQPSTDEEWWQAGEEVRQSLKLQPKSHWSALLEKQPANPQDLTEHYRSLVKYDGQKRAVAIALCGGDVSKNETPEKVLDRLNDLQVATYHDWRVRRAILDFYGPTESKPGSEPFYKHHAKFWLGELDKPGVQEQNFSQGLAGRRFLESWTSVSEPLLSVTVRPPMLDFIDNEPKSLPVDVTVAVSAMGDLRPVGAVAVEVPSQPGSAQLTERVAATDLLVSSGNSSPWKTPRDVPPGNSAVPVRAFFRGHTALDAEILRKHMKSEPPVERDVPPPEPTPPDATVIVRGRSPQKLWLMIVLDCSKSMNDEMTTETGRKVTRFDVATKALKEMLQTLLTETEKTNCELHIGLIAYGYRVGIWKFEDSGWKLGYADPDKKTEPPKKVPPIEDVDTVEDKVNDLSTLDPSLDVGVLVSIKNKNVWNGASYLQMNNLIDRRSAVGITPLYLSIVKAADHMKFLPKDAPKLILVITDGVDNQETLGNTAEDMAKRVAWGLKGFSAQPTGESAAKNAVAIPNGPDVRIVGIGIPPKAEANVPELDGIKSLESFCKKENGQDRSVREFIQTNSGGELAKKITVAIPPVTFRIRRAEGMGDQDQFASPFNNHLKIENAKGKKFHIEVTRELQNVQQALATTDANKGLPLTIYGGEHFELLYIDKLKKLVFHRGWENRANDDDPAANEKNVLKRSYDVPPPDIRDVRNQAGKKWQAALLTPKVEGGTRRFRVAFRPDNESEPPSRPTLVRATITPLKDGRNDNVICPYFFESADIRFEPKQSVPVLEFVSTDWKPEWTEANLSIWLRAPGDEATESGGITIARDLLKEAGKESTVPMTGGDLSISIGKQEIVAGDAVITIQQKWDKVVQLPNIENLPILQVDPGSKGFRRSVRVAGQQVIYKFKFPLEEVGRTAYQLRVLDPATLPEVRDQEGPVKKLKWEKIKLDK